MDPRLGGGHISAALSTAQGIEGFLDISPTQRRITVLKLRSLIGKLRSMHLVVSGAIRNFFYIQEALTKAGTGTKAYLSKEFHQGISHCQRLCKGLLDRSQLLAEVVQLLPAALGLYEALGLGAGGFWIDPDGTGATFVWWVQCPVEIVSDLVTWDNPAGGITNLYLELATLVLQESCFLIAFSFPD